MSIDGINGLSSNSQIQGDSKIDPPETIIAHPASPDYWDESLEGGIFGDLRTPEEALEEAVQDVGEKIAEKISDKSENLPSVKDLFGVELADSDDTLFGEMINLPEQEND